MEYTNWRLTIVKQNKLSPGTREYIKPKILVSKCLEFDACRYDGQQIINKPIRALKPFVEFVPVCPEVEIGLGIPRDTIKIIKNKNEKKLFQSTTGIDLTDKMYSFSKHFFHKQKIFDGFILKSKSPSCGIKTTKYFKEDSPDLAGFGSGLFTDYILKYFPYYPKEEDKRLNNVALREHFLTAIFTIADFKEVQTAKDLYSFHGKNKYLFMNYNQSCLKKMGQVAAKINNKNSPSIIKEYFDLLLYIFSKRPRRNSNINTQMHVFGYFKKELSAKEKSYFLELLDSYREKSTPLSSLNSILYAWIIRFNNDYLKQQTYFQPFPIEITNELS